MTSALSMASTAQVATHNEKPNCSESQLPTAIDTTVAEQMTNASAKRGWAGATDDEITFVIMAQPVFAMNCEVEDEIGTGGHGFGTHEKTQRKPLKLIRFRRKPHMSDNGKIDRSMATPQVVAGLRRGAPGAIHLGDRSTTTSLPIVRFISNIPRTNRVAINLQSRTIVGCQGGDETESARHLR